MVRVPSDAYHHIARALDMGAEGIIVPMVGSAEQAAAIVEKMKYTPDRQARRRPRLGNDRYRHGPGRPTRSRPPTRGRGSSPDRDRRRRRERRRDRRDRRRRLLWVGHFDLTVSLGIPGEFDHPDFKRRDRQGRSRPARSTTSGSAAWCRTSTPGVDARARGLRLHLLSGDVWLLQVAIRQGIDGIRAGAAGRARRARRMSEHLPRRALRRFPQGRRLADLSRFRPRRRCARRRASRWRSSSRASPLRAEQLEDFDALILLTHRFAAESVPKSGRLAVVARFGVGYDTVDVEACTEAGIALVITPGRRAPAGRGLDHHAACWR